MYGLILTVKVQQMQKSGGKQREGEAPGCRPRTSREMTGVVPESDVLLESDFRLRERARPVKAAPPSLRVQLWSTAAPMRMEQKSTLIVNMSL